MIQIRVIAEAYDCIRSTIQIIYRFLYTHSNLQNPKEDFHRFRKTSTLWRIKSPIITLRLEVRNHGNIKKKAIHELAIAETPFLCNREQLFARRSPFHHAVLLGRSNFHPLSFARCYQFRNCHLQSLSWENNLEIKTLILTKPWRQLLRKLLYNSTARAFNSRKLLAEHEIKKFREDLLELWFPRHLTWAVMR